MFPVTSQDGELVGEVWFVWKDGAWHLGRSQFIKAFEKPLRYDECGRLSLAAEERDWAALDTFHPEALPWFCRTCAQNYPESSWRIERIDEDGWWPDTYLGFCLEGHERIIAD